VLKEHRNWYLTKKKFKKKWVGVLPRIQGISPHPANVGYEKWYVPMTMTMHSLVEIEVKILSSHTPGDTDLLTALRGFQLKTLVSCCCSKAMSLPKPSPRGHPRGWASDRDVSRVVFAAIPARDPN
jgi:hypothetical protein